MTPAHHSSERVVGVLSLASAILYAVAAPAAVFDAAVLGGLVATFLVAVAVNVWRTPPPPARPVTRASAPSIETLLRRAYLRGEISTERFEALVWRALRVSMLDRRMNIDTRRLHDGKALDDVLDVLYLDARRRGGVRYLVAGPEGEPIEVRTGMAGPDAPLYRVGEWPPDAEAVE